MTPEYVYPLYSLYSSDGLTLAYAAIGAIVTVGIFLVALYESYLSRLHGAHVNASERLVPQTGTQADARVRNTRGGVLSNVYATDCVTAQDEGEPPAQRVA